jgi:hypothetical protein
VKANLNTDKDLNTNEVWKCLVENIKNLMSSQEEVKYNISEKMILTIAEVRAVELVFIIKILLNLRWRKSSRII